MPKLRWENVGGEDCVMMQCGRLTVLSVPGGYTFNLPGDYESRSLYSHPEYISVKEAQDAAESALLNMLRKDIRSLKGK